MMILTKEDFKYIYMIHLSENVVGNAGDQTETKQKTPK